MYRPYYFLGIKSIESEGTTTKSQILQEKQQLQESYSQRFKELTSEIDGLKHKVSLHSEAKNVLEKQIEKLKKEVTKKIDTQRQLTDKLKEKDIELTKSHEKTIEVLYLILYDVFIFVLYCSGFLQSGKVREKKAFFTLVRRCQEKSGNFKK